MTMHAFVGPDDAGADTEMVRAGGGLIVRAGVGGRPEIAVVHRPHRFDWSLPKGKLEPGEDFADAARREVAEETGFRCRLVRFVGTTHYQDRKDRPKLVAYWAMTVEDGGFVPNGEVDQIAWVDAAGAASLLSYERDRELVAGFLAELTEPADLEDLGVSGDHDPAEAGSSDRRA